MRMRSLTDALKMYVYCGMRMRTWGPQTCAHTLRVMLHVNMLCVSCACTPVHAVPLMPACVHICMISISGAICAGDPFAPGTNLCHFAHSAKEFDDDLQCVEKLSRFVTELGIDRASRDAAVAYKMDESASWEQWFDQTGLSFSNLTGRDAPHYFRLALRMDLGNMGLSSGGHMGREERNINVGEVEGAAKDGSDVMLVVKARMASLRVSQVCCVFPAAFRGRLQLQQPRGLHPRRPGGDAVKAKMATVAKQLSQERVISAAARAYLVDWANGVRPRQPRPLRYSFLDCQWRAEAPGVPLRDPVHVPGPVRLVRVRLLGMQGAPLPEDAEEEDPGQLVEFNID